MKSSVPNILFIFTDEQAYRTMKIYGNDHIKTPHLDSLAGESVVFEHAYVTQPVCTPSRASIMTGLYPHTHGLINNNMHLSEEFLCIPKMIKNNDFYTGYFGKWHLGDEIFLQHGFDEWVSTEDEYRPWYSSEREKNLNCNYKKYLKDKGYECDVAEDSFSMYSRKFCTKVKKEDSKPYFLAENACRFIEDNSHRPFILYVNYLEPHMPFYGPLDDMYDPELIELPENFINEAEELTFKEKVLKNRYKKEGFDNEPLKTENDWKKLIARYYGLISLVDESVGIILNKLNQQGLDENTIIVFTSDHGDMMGSHGLLAKGVMFEESIKVPCMIKVPNRKHEFVPKQISQIDLLPSLLDLINEPILEELEGISHASFLRGESEYMEQDVYVEWYGERDQNINSLKKEIGMWMDESYKEEATKFLADANCIISKDRMKYIGYTSGEEKLYDLKIDACEKNDLSKKIEYKNIKLELAEKIERWKFK